MGLLNTTTGELLVSLCLTLLVWGAEGQGTGKVKLVLGSEEINLGQHQGTWAPLMQTRENLTQVKSIRSTFLFRTFDPEGVVFYGDTLNGKDWFILALKDGIPEMQIGKADILVSMHGGPKINDGKWHLLEISNNGDFVRLNVDSQKEVIVGLKSKMTESVLQGQIRLAIGGILVSPENLLVPFQPAMDGCIRQGNWLNLSMPWETQQLGEPRPCYANIEPGSYFTGAGVATFNTTELPAYQTEDIGITISIQGDSSMLNGTILSLKTPGEEIATTRLIVDNDLKNIKLTIRTIESISKSIRFTKLTLTLKKNQLNMKTDETEMKLESDDIPDYLSRWKEGMILAFGGLQEDRAPDNSNQYLKGCLAKIQVLGQDVDLDRALYKDASISSHSCPS
ncbi:sex hormone-binding globulin [Esox lucius]|uniref:Sex hormone-binding globulin n=1 Tax=Esox lucius TaxID=8010 RepID=A0A3P8YBY8_ESOLU|nr:sex hormone-binding globulin [Esox lucius]XP_019898944.2 sex hormone-binding globulin [Esox lucius]